ncbi:hypothetical protein [Methylotuvimicrobium buryatense]|uniref:Autotransporter outer membrane beta-barrel domain-containing protein n=1 Tax=Methylotuvimicrobium buryatense TaxID=95641 RepID=A0A4P9URP6_METBY|nr:hypothetical protein [Methylotuvimicrobium buryatense]QCW84172.1 autotransporter outer membrane beta-barrel domain-containing protein [Methylotuvimicrobium buryatense]
MHKITSRNSQLCGGSVTRLTGRRDYILVGLTASVPAADTSQASHRTPFLHLKKLFHARSLIVTGPDNIRRSLLEKRCRFLALVGLVSVSAWGQVPELNMHVFETPPAPIPVTNITAGLDQDEMTSFQMVIFDPEAEAETLDEYPRHRQRRQVVDDFSVLVAGDIGYQRESLAWSVASADGAIDPITRVEWQDLDTWKLKGRMDIVSPSGITLRGDAGYAWVLNGSGQEAGFDGAPNSQNAGDGYSWDVSVGLGYRLQVGDTESVAFAATPLAGYAWRRQRYVMQGVEENRYAASWQGPWVGLDTSLTWLDYHQLFVSAQYHWADYEASGDWRQLADVRHPDSFEHEADATGYLGSLGYRYMRPEGWGLSLSFDYQKWQGDPGQERFYFANGEVVESRFKDLSRESVGVNLGINLQF